MNTDGPTYRRYAERLIVNLVTHYKGNPTVIGWQIDNELASYGASDPQVLAEFVERLKKKFVTIDTLNEAWFLNYWGHGVNEGKEMPMRDNATSTSYKLEWSRFGQDRVTNFLASPRTAKSGILLSSFVVRESFLALSRFRAG